MDENELKCREPTTNIVSSSLNNIDVSLSSQKDTDDSLGKLQDDDEGTRNFIIPIYKKWKIRINKSLILLKLALFLWYGAGSGVLAFIFIFFKQKGISVTELAIIHAILPFVNFLGPMISGIISDKIGSSKPVLIGILLLTAISVVSIVVIPDMNVMKCDPQKVNLKCHHQEFGQLIAKSDSDISANVAEFTSCNVTCPEKITQQYNEQNLICNQLKRNENKSNFTLLAKVSLVYKIQGKFYYNITSISRRNITYSVCDVPDEMNCTISCLINPSDNCSSSDDGRTAIVILNATILILFYTFLSTVYRIMDVTAMALVKEHNSDFGRQRFFSMVGVFVFSTFSGYLVTASTINPEDKNYKTGLYVFVVMIFMLIAVIYKLKVQVKRPGKNMWKKSFSLLKKPDVITFVVLLIVLGSAFGFNAIFLFWYLEGLGASSFLLGLINGLGGLYGLPFLFTSNWWIKTIGTEQIIILGLLGYVAEEIGYSLLYEPWFSVFIQATQIVTFHLLWVALVVHSHSIAPEGLTATVIALAGAIHFDLGYGAGGLIGGYIMNAFGGRIAFRTIGVSCFIVAVLYGVYLYVRKRVQKMDDCGPCQENIKVETELKCSTLCTEDT